MRQSEYGAISGNYELKLLRELDKQMHDELHATIFYTENCMKCAVTKRQLHMPCEMVLISRNDPDSQEIIEYMDNRGWQSAPLVIIYRGDKQVDIWHDMRVDKIREWNGEG